MPPISSGSTASQSSTVIGSSIARAVAAGFLTGPAGSSDFKDEDTDMGMQMAHITGEKALEPLLREI